MNRLSNNGVIAIVFDLDQTIGDFGAVGMLKDCVDNLYAMLRLNKLSNKNAFDMFDLFPEMFRYNIFDILNQIKKINNVILNVKVYIYTNNNKNKEWVQLIADYMSYKLGFNVFTYIVAAYKVDNIQIEARRTTYEKTLEDLLTCTGLTKHDKICFIDDIYHPKMRRPNIYYINIAPYTHAYDFNNIVKKYHSKYLTSIIPLNNLTHFMNKQGYFISNTTKSINDIENDKHNSVTLSKCITNFIINNGKGYDINKHV